MSSWSLPGVGAGFGAMLIAGGAIGMITNIVDSSIGGGIGSILNGSGAISTGISLFSYGWVGAIFGTLMVGIGAATMVLGANEVTYGITKHNYLQEWTGMSDSVYSGLYLGLNIASSIGTIAGRLGMRAASSIYSSRADLNYKPYGKITTNKNIYYYNGKGNPYWAIHNYNQPIINNPSGFHWHTSLGRDNQHIYSYLEFLIKFITMRW